MKYGDDQRLPLVYLETYSTKPSYSYALPTDIIDEPLSTYLSFPKLSKEILVTLFSSIGVTYVPEVALYELAIKTPEKAFVDFCITFGMEDNEMVNSSILNQVIGYLRDMDQSRRDRPFDSRPIYKALADRDFEEADRLIREIKIEG